MSIVGSHEVTVARCAFPFDSVTQPIFDEMTGISASAGSLGSATTFVEETGAMVTTDVDSPEDCAVCDAVAQP